MLTRDDRGAVLGGAALAEILRSHAVRTPAYVYDLDGIEAGARALAAGFGGAPHLVAYAVKASSAGPIVRALVGAGTGAEVVSGGELAVALRSGVRADRILWSGVGKQAWEIDRAIGAGDRGILAIQIESVEEIARVDARAAALGRRARVSLRINPGVVADTHAHVATGHDEAKFGVARADLDAAWAALARAAPHLDLTWGSAATSDPSSPPRPTTSPPPRSASPSPPSAAAPPATAAPTPPAPPSPSSTSAAASASTTAPPAPPTSPPLPRPPPPPTSPAPPRASSPDPTSPTSASSSSRAAAWSRRTASSAPP